jgi:hypothetical protein
MDWARYTRGNSVYLDGTASGFRDSAHFFGNALAKELWTTALGQGALIQYVDYLLICSPTKLDLDKNHSSS